MQENTEYYSIIDPQSYFTPIGSLALDIQEFLISGNYKKSSLSQNDRCTCGHIRSYHARKFPKKSPTKCNKCECPEFKVPKLKAS